MLITMPPVIYQKYIDSENIFGFIKIGIITMISPIPNIKGEIIKGIKLRSFTRIFAILHPEKINPNPNNNIADMALYSKRDHFAKK